MTTARQAAANARNATRSSGPRTLVGKARTALNALRHGLTAKLLLLPGECARDWAEHQAGILRSLAPEGALEAALANRVAVCLWRLRRVIAFETGVTAVGLQQVPEEIRAQDAAVDLQPGAELPPTVRLQLLLAELAEKREVFRSRQQVVQLLEALPEAAEETVVGGRVAFDLLEELECLFPHGEKSYGWDSSDFLSRLGIPPDHLAEAFRWPGWTVGMVRRAVAEVAAWHEADPGALFARGLAKLQHWQEEWKTVLREREAQVEALRQRIQAREERLRQQRLLPDEKVLLSIARYESHLTRQMLQALHELQRLQALRAGQAVLPPAALDVMIDVEGAGSALPALAKAGTVNGNAERRRRSGFALQNDGRLRR